MSGPISKKFGVIRVGITQGELSGIAPEIIALALKEFDNDKTIELCVIASKKGIEDIKSNLKKPLGKHITFIEPDIDELPAKVAQSDVLSSIYYAAKLTMNKELDAIVTAPIDKNKIGKKYHGFSGHTGFLKQILKAENVLMLMSTPSLKIGIMTEHIPLKDVAEHVTKKRIIDAATLFNEHLSKTKIEPRIGVLALNPHSGESGLVGTEETTIIIPAIKHLNSININAVGPIPGDSAFVSPIKEKCDGILAMYHDQGMIPAKIRGFDGLVNITLGLPIIRTSPGHGVAYDIKGTGIASPASMIKAINTAVDMVLAERL
jgi:4-hydroxythreonine-4-phosphate dehydrogenase